MSAAVPRPVRSRSGGPPVPWLKPAVFVGSLMPLAGLALRGMRGTLGADPIAYVLNQLGLLTLIFLIATLALTPLRRLFGWTWPIRIRRMVGLFAFFYATLHVLFYALVDQGLAWGAILEDITKRRFIFVGFMAWVLLIPLAITSTNHAVRVMGAERWQRLHRLAYVCAVLGIVHFIWRVKRDMTEPLIYGSVVALLLLLRVVFAWQDRQHRRARACARAATSAGPGSTPPG
jgi:methionine sulfoxide reductase heme-binding subunit